MVPPKRSPKKTMAAWVADLEEGAVRAPAGISSGAPPVSGQALCARAEASSPYQTMDPDPSDPAPASAPAPASRPAASRRATTPAGASAASSRASSARGVRGTSTRSTVSSNAKASLVRRHANRDHDRDPDAPAPAEDARARGPALGPRGGRDGRVRRRARRGVSRHGERRRRTRRGHARIWSNVQLGVRGRRARAVSGTTRKKLQSRAAVKVTAARVRLRELTAAFDGARNYANALSAALDVGTAQSAAVRQLQSTAGYAEETTARLRQTSAAHRRAEMTAKQLGEALDAANAHIADVSSRLEIKTREAAEVIRAGNSPRNRKTRWNAPNARRNPRRNTKRLWRNSPRITWCF